MATNKQGNPAKPGPPRRTSEPAPAMADHSFTLQAIMELQKSIGKMDGKLDGLGERMGKVEQRLDRLDEKLSGRMDKIDEKLSVVTHKLYAAGVVLAIALGVGAFLLDKSWDRALDLLASQVKPQVSQHP